MTRPESCVRVLLVLLVCAIGIPDGAAAQTSCDAGRRDRPRTALWTVVGAAAGFGVGLWGGLTVFDDAINSDRKVWTTAVLSAAGGGAAGYLIGRRGGKQKGQSTRQKEPAGGPAPFTRTAVRRRNHRLAASPAATAIRDATCLEATGLDTGAWTALADRSDIKTYTLTARGRRRLQTEKVNRPIVLAMGRMLEGT